MNSASKITSLIASLHWNLNCITIKKNYEVISVLIPLVDLTACSIAKKVVLKAVGLIASSALCINLLNCGIDVKI